MNDYHDTLQGTLNDYLKTPRTVMSFGMAGAEMPDYLGTAPLVRDEFAPQWAVIVITAGDFTRGFKAAPGYFEWEPDRYAPHPAGAGDPPLGHGQAAAHRGTDPLRCAAICRYDRKSSSACTARAAESGKPPRAVPRYLSSAGRGAADRLCARTAGGARVGAGSASSWCSTRIAEVLAPGKLPGSPGSQCALRGTLANDRLREIAAQAGMHVIDSVPVFQRHVAAGLGPVDRSPLDPHWNPAAHRLMAQEVARVIDP